MNKYDQYYDFRIATKNDTEFIMNFIKQEYDANCILATDKEMFLFQYQGADDRINVYLMLNKKGEIQGINGYIQYAESEDKKYISSALTKVKDNLPIPLSGIELIRRFKQYTKAEAYFSSGTNPRTMIPIGKRIFKYTVGLVQQYYCLNNVKTDFKIAVINQKSPSAYCINKNIVLKKIKKFSELENFFSIEKTFPNLPYKSKNYIDKRFFHHPIYTYDVYSIYNKKLKKTDGVLFTRKIQVNESCIIRIVDYVGDIKKIAYIGGEIQKIIQLEDAEFIDFQTVGMPPNILQKAGFTLRKEIDNNVLPTYFDPFIQENINIWYQTSNNKLIIFKADGDQDRPNHR